MQQGGGGSDTSTKWIVLRKKSVLLILILSTVLFTVIVRYRQLPVDSSSDDHQLDHVVETIRLSSPIQAPETWTGGAKLVQVTYRDVNQTPPKMFQKALGRIGNCLFAIAAVYALTRKTTHLPVLADGFQYLHTSFPNLNMSFEPLPPDENVTVIGEHGFSSYSPDLYTNVPQNDILLSGYYQSFKYFIPYENEIRTLFQFSDVLVSHAEVLLHEIKKDHLSKHKHIDSNLTFVGIHVRHGDVTQQADLGYNVANVSYIYRAMHYFRKRYGNVAFVLCTDDARWCRENIVAEDVHQPASGTAEQDLALLSRCNHTVVTVGTYSWWAGWLAGGEVTYYPPYNRSQGIGKNFTPKDFFPPDWLSLSELTREQLEVAIMLDKRAI